jgi:3-phosphoshikimate 1-carboxyvinyltransferase
MSGGCRRYNGSMRQTFDSSEMGRSPGPRNSFDDPSLPRGFSPRRPISGTLTPPVSKSLAQRALLFAGLATGKTRITGAQHLGACDDIIATIGVLENLGRPLDWVGPRAVTVTGLAPGHIGGLQPTGPFEVGESATLARLASAVAGFCCSGSASVRGIGTLERRRSPALFSALERAGIRLRQSEVGAWPVGMDSIGPPSDLFLENPSSSQELSALLLAAACYPDAIQVHVRGDLPSRPYLELTRSMLKTFGVLAVPVDPRFEGGSSYEVQGVLTSPKEPIHLEPDASSAAVALCAAAITGGDLEVPGPWGKSTQGDRQIVDFLVQFGVNAGHVTSGEMEVDIETLATSGLPIRGAILDLSRHPDLAAPLAAVAAYAALHCAGVSELLGLKTLVGKESNRLDVLATGLAALGVNVEVRNDSKVCGLRIGPGEQAPQDDVEHLLDPKGDHRMAFAFALFGLLRPGIQVADPMCVSKSWPGFWEDLGAL